MVSYYDYDPENDGQSDCEPNGYGVNENYDDAHDYQSEDHYVDEYAPTESYHDGPPDYECNGYHANEYYDDARDYQSEDHYVDDYTANDSYHDAPFANNPPSYGSRTSNSFTNEQYTGRSSAGEISGDQSRAYESPFSDGDDERSFRDDTSTTACYTPNTTSASSSQLTDKFGNLYTVTRHGINSQGNHWCTRDYGRDVPNRNAYHYSNQDGSYYYLNPNGSTYYNDGRGFTKYTPPSPEAKKEDIKGKKR